MRRTDTICNECMQSIGIGWQHTAIIAMICENVFGVFARHMGLFTSHAQPSQSIASHALCVFMDLCIFYNYTPNGWPQMYRSRSGRSFASEISSI